MPETRSAAEPAPERHTKPDAKPAVPDGEGGLVRVRLDLGYDGTEFAGWAAQPGQRTVEATLAQALARVLRLAEPPRLVVAGRTDAGVHARGQVCHLDLPAACWQAANGGCDVRTSPALVRRLAGVLPADIRVGGASVAPSGFDARFAAVGRRYAYRISEAPGGPDPLRRREVLDYRRELDLDAMRAASTQLLGLRDFTAFCRRREGATSIRTLVEFSWARPPVGAADGGLVVATLLADAFCHSMVRALVGALLPVGLGQRPSRWPADVLAAGVREPAVTVVAARGLTLEQVLYPPDAELAGRADQARAVRHLP